MPMPMLGDMSGSMFLWLLGSVLVFQTCVTTKGHSDDPDLDCCLGNYADLSHPSLDSTLERVGLELLMSITLKLALMAGVPVGQPKHKSVGDLTLTLICLGVEEMPFPPASLTIWHKWLTWPRVHESRRAASSFHHLKHPEWSLHFACKTAQVAVVVKVSMTCPR